MKTLCAKKLQFLLLALRFDSTIVKLNPVLPKNSLISVWSKKLLLLGFVWIGSWLIANNKVKYNFLITIMKLKGKYRCD